MNQMNQPRLHPTGDRILIETKAPKTITKSGIIIPDTVEKEQVTSGIIVAIGRDVKSNVKIGDKLLISKHSGVSMGLNGKQYLMVHDTDALAVYTD